MRVGQPRNSGWSGLRFDADVVIDSGPQFLLAAEVLLGRLHTDMPEEKLDLLQFASRNVAQTGTGTSQIVRGKIAKLSFRGKLLHHAPDYFL